MLSAQESIKGFIANAEATKLDLLDTQQDLVDIKKDFDPRYKRIKELQSIVNGDVEKTNQSRESFGKDIDDLKKEIDGMKQQIADFREKNDIDDLVEEYNKQAANLTKTANAS